MSAAAAEIPHPVVIEEFVARRQNSLRGFAKVQLASGMILHDVAIHVGGDNKFWASPPSKAMLDREGHALRDVDGKVRYVPIIAFTTKEQRDRFSQVVADAVRAAHPQALT